MAVAATAIDLSGLTSLELDVIDALAANRVTASSVTLAASLWKDVDTDPTNRWRVGDPVGLVTFVLEGLNERDLVTYRLRQGPHAGPYAGLPMEVCLTRHGWVAAGFPTIHAHVGHGTRHARDAAKHLGDMTNYRNHPDTARGVGPIEVDTFADHRVLFPDHVHPLMNGDDTMAAAEPDTRVYTRVTPEVEGHVLAVRERLGIGAAYADIATVVGIPERTVRYILTDLPRLRRVNDGEQEAQRSLKQRIVDALTELPEVESARELRRILGMADTDHDVVHVLHSLHKAGTVDFDEKGASKEPIRIHLRREAKAKAKPQAITPPEQPVGPEPEPEPEPTKSWPLLGDLIERERKRRDGDEKTERYMRAAEAIKDIDPEAYALLMQKAEANDIPFLSPIEAEYVAYAQAHPPTHVNDHGVDMDKPMALVPRE